MSNNWIGMIKLTSETEILDGNGDAIHDYLELSEVGSVRQFVNHAVRPTLYNKLGEAMPDTNTKVTQSYRGGINWEDALYDHATNRSDFEESYDKVLNFNMFNGQYGTPLAGSSGVDAWINSEIKLWGAACELYAYSKLRSGENYVAKSGIQFLDDHGEVILEMLHISDNNTYTTTATKRGSAPVDVTNGALVPIEFNVAEDTVTINSVTLTDIQFSSITDYNLLSYASSTYSTSEDTAISYIVISLPVLPRMTAPDGSPNPYKIIADKYTPAIGDTYESNKDKYTEGGVALFDLLEQDGSAFDPQVYPELAAFFGTPPATYKLSNPDIMIIGIPTIPIDSGDYVEFDFTELEEPTANLQVLAYSEVSGVGGRCYLQGDGAFMMSGPTYGSIYIDDVLVSLPHALPTTGARHRARLIANSETLNIAWFGAIPEDPVRLGYLGIISNIVVAKAGVVVHAYPIDDGWGENPKLRDTIGGAHGTATGFIESGWSSAYVLPNNPAPEGVDWVYSSVADLTEDDS